MLISESLLAPGRIVVLIFWFGLVCAPSGFGQFAPNRYALLLQDQPVASRFPAEAQNYGRRIQAAQTALRNELEARRIQVAGSANILLNAVFVLAPNNRVAELGGLPGVIAVVPMRTFRRNLNQAL